MCGKELESTASERVQRQAEIKFTFHEKR